MRNSIILSRVLCSLLTVFVFTAGTIQAESPDFGNDAAAAETITADGVNHYGTISPSGDEDWLSFTPAGMTRYKLTFNNPESNYKTVDIFQEDEFGSLVTLNIRKSAWTNTITFDFFLNATYKCYIRIYGGDGNYAWKLEEVTTRNADGFPDTCGDAVTLTVDAAPTNGVIYPDSEPFTDSDWFTFSTQPLHKYQVTLSHTSNSWVRFSVWLDDCSTRIHNSDYSFNFVSWYGDDYKLQVFGDMNRLGNYYEIQVKDIGTFIDDHGNTPEESTAIAADGSFIFAKIDYNADLYSDEDWFHFSPVVHTRYRVLFNNPESNYKTVTLFQEDEFGNLVPLNLSKSSWNNQVALEFFLDANRDFFIKIHGGVGQYAFKVETLDTVNPDGVADNCSDAETITIDAPPTIGTIYPDNEPFSDTDWYIFTPMALHKYEITLTHTENSWVRYRLIKDDCLTQIRGDSYHTTLISWYGEPVKIKVFGDLNRLGNYYTLEVKDIDNFTDDHGNDKDHATYITQKNGTWITGHIDYGADIGSDEDWFKFIAGVDGTYTLGFAHGLPHYKRFTLFGTDDFGFLQEKDNYSLWNDQRVKDYTLTAGIYYIRIRDGSGDYNLKILSPEPQCGDMEHPYLPGDINHDCYVNMLDFVQMVNNWLSCDHPDPPCNYVP